MTVERTLVLVKPDGVQRGLVGEVIGRLERRGLQLVGLKLMQIDEGLAGRHYAEHRQKAFFPGLNHVRRAQARYDERRTLIQAALAVQVDGRDALKNYTDPVVGGPLEYTAFPGGFELRSKWKPEDKPVTLVIGQRGK